VIGALVVVVVVVVVVALPHDPLSLKPIAPLSKLFVFTSDRVHAARIGGVSSPLSVWAYALSRYFTFSPSPFALPSSIACTPSEGGEERGMGPSPRRKYETGEEAGRMAEEIDMDMEMGS
jgi:hypothetical protein